jgi:hypothetical protein
MTEQMTAEQVMAEQWLLVEMLLEEEDLYDEMLQLSSCGSRVTAVLLLARVASAEV